MANKHPLLGKNALLLDSDLSDNALRIIYEHHERNDGKGFPKGLSKTRIFSGTKIVSIANAFDKLVDKNTGSLKHKQLKAISVLATDKGRYFDPSVLSRCIEALSSVV